MKIGFNQATTMKYATLEQDLACCEKYGYDVIEIRFDKLKDYLTRHNVGALADYFAASHIKPCTFNALEFITFRNSADYRALTDDLKFLCETGGAIGCDTVIVVPTFDVRRTRAEIIAESVGVLREFGDIAAGYGAKLAFEFVGYPNCSVNTLDLADEIVVLTGRENVGLVLDCFHFHAMNSSWRALENLDTGRLFVLHLDDAEDIIPGMLRDENRLWPGDGYVDLGRILKTVAAAGYDGVVSLELFRPEYWEMDIETAIATGLDKTRAVIEKALGQPAG